MKNGNGSLMKKRNRRGIMLSLRLLTMAGLCMAAVLFCSMQVSVLDVQAVGKSSGKKAEEEAQKKEEEAKKKEEEAKKKAEAYERYEDILTPEEFAAFIEFLDKYEEYSEVFTTFEEFEDWLIYLLGYEEEAKKKKEEEAKRKEEEAKKKAEEAAYIKQHGLKAEDNTYILDLTTGTKAGDNISFFIISYKSGGEDRSIYVFPKAGDFAEGMEELNEYSRKYGVDAQAVNKEYMSYTDVENAAPVGSTATAPMQSGTNNQVVFHTKEKIDQITNVEFFTRYNAAAKTSNEWTCQGLRIYEVDRVRGINMVGGFSKDYFANFTGTLLADVKFQNASQDGGFHTFSWALDVIESFGGITVKDAKGKETHKDNPYLTLKTTDFGEAAKYDPQTNDCYGFRIDIADQPQAGLECLTYRNKASLRGAEYIEDLALKLVYTDVNEKPHIIYLPVVTNALKWAADNGINTTDIAGVAQNGQSLFFSGNIPGLSTVQSASIVVGNAMSINACGMKKSSSSSQIRQVRMTASEEDSLTIRCFAIYHMSDDVNVSVKADGAFLSYNYSGVPVYYRRAETEYGIELKAGEETILQLSKPEEESDLAPAGWKTKKYLIGVTTDSTARAGTVADVQMQLTYTNMAGMTAKTSWVSLKDKAMDYYGFWYSSSAPTGNFGYLAGMCPGNTLYYVVEAADVDQFTNAQYRLESGTDEWQTNGLQIWVLDTLTAPKAEWTSVSAKNGDTTLTSEVRFYREFTGINILDIQGRTIDGKNDNGDDGDDSTGTYLPDSVLVASNDTVSWKFKTKGAQEVEEEQYADLTYSMTYEECLQDFGFDKRRETYIVKVQVSDQAVDLSGNGDCGSENNFYFQLLFENGASSVVLANTQLEGDRFRTGNVETFAIGTNKDYGAVTAVRIIPEQVQEDSVIDDKLKIDEISVVRQSGSSFCETYVVEHSALPNDGWIGTQSYLDDAQKKETRSDKIGRMVDEIAVDLPVTAKTNEINILCCLSIEEYAKDTAQFYGEMKMTMEYIKLDGTPAKETFDIVDAMYDYYGKTVQHDTDTDTNGRTTSRQPAVSETAYMFRGGHTDRFYITLRDVKSLYMVTLTGQSRGDTSQLNVSAISFNTVEEEGSLQLSGNDEYVRTGATTYVTSNSVETSETSKLGNTFGKGQDQKIKIGLLTNEIEIKEQGSQWLAVFSREPVSQNDTLNVYIYPTSNSMPVANWDLYTRAFYTNVSGLQLTSALTLMNKHIATDENDKSYFYLNGLSAKQLASLDHIYAISGNQGNNLNAYIDYAIIQQVRSGTVINTWQRAGNNAMASLGVDMGTQSYVAQGQYDMQKVFLQLAAAGTEEAKLTAEQNDIAVSLKYTSTLDPTGKEVYSAYRYITDDQYTKISAGELLELTFEQPYVKEVTGIRLVKAGNLYATVESAAVANYSRSGTDDEQPVLSGWFSFPDSLSVGTTPTTMSAKGTELASPNVVQPLSVTFETSAAGGYTESGTESPVRMTVCYEDAYGDGKTQIINDIRPYIVGRDQHAFLTGQKQEIRLLTGGMQKVRYIDLEPYSTGVTGNDALAGWSLDTVTVKLGENGSLLSRSVGERIYEGSPKRINFQNLTMMLSAYYDSEAAGGRDTRTVVDKDMDFTVASNKEVTFRPVLTGSISEMSVTVERKVGDTSEKIDVSGVLKKQEIKGSDQFEYIFTPDRNFSGQNVVYYVTFASEENSAVACKATVTVQSEEAVSDDTGTEGDDTGTEGDDTTQ